MPVSYQPQRTSQFKDSSPLIALGALAILGCAGVLSLLLHKTLIDQQVTVFPEESVSLEPVQLKKSPIGALRIDVSAVIPTNRWVTYEISLMNAEGEVLVSAMKQAWRESGTWYEDGESGTWQEEDVRGGLDVRTVATGPITIVLSVLEYGETSGNEIEDPVSLRVNVHNGVIDGRYMLVGLIATVVLIVLSFNAVNGSGKCIIDKSIGDSDLGGRAIMGGPDSLIKVTAIIKSDETSPAKFKIHLYIKDKNGEQIYYHVFTISRGAKNNDVCWQTWQQHFVLESRDSYNVYVEVMPDGPVDSTRLTVKENVCTLQAVEYIHIRC